MEAKSERATKIDTKMITEQRAKWPQARVHLFNTDTDTDTNIHYNMWYI